MGPNKMKPLVVLALVGLISALFLLADKPASVSAQQPTVAVATVTGTPKGPFVRVTSDQEQINVRYGPKTTYDIVGVLVAGQEVPALGKTAAGDWIQISYLGIPEGVAWVYSFLVTVIGGAELPIVEPPPLPTPRITSTIDPTLAAQFIQEIPATRMPTFTAPAPLIIPTFEAPSSGFVGSNFPVGLIIAVMAVVGIFGVLISFFRRR